MDVPTVETTARTGRPPAPARARLHAVFGTIGLLALA